MPGWHAVLQGVPLLQCYGTNRAIHVGTVVMQLQVGARCSSCITLSCEPQCWGTMQCSLLTVASQPLTAPTVGATPCWLTCSSSSVPSSVCPQFVWCSAHARRYSSQCSTVDRQQPQHTAHMLVHGASHAVRLCYAERARQAPGCVHHRQE